MRPMRPTSVARPKAIFLDGGAACRRRAAERRGHHGLPRPRERVSHRSAGDRQTSSLTRSVPERNDPLMSYMALQTVFNSPAGTSRPLLASPDCRRCVDPSL